MMTSEMEEFAKILVERVRDAAIRHCDRNLQPETGNVIAKRWREAAAKGTLEAFARVSIPDIVDSTISCLLGTIDQELLRLSFTASDGKSLDLTAIAKESGELSGWYKGAGGWCEKYSKERFVDDFVDLKDFFKKARER